MIELTYFGKHLVERMRSRKQEDIDLAIREWHQEIVRRGIQALMEEKL